MAASSACSHCGALRAAARKRKGKTRSVFIAASAASTSSSLTPAACRLRRLRNSASAPSLRSPSSRSHTSRFVSPFTASGSRERNLPGVGRGQLVLGQALPQRSLRLVHRARVREEEHVAQANRSGAIVLGQRVLVELAECRGQPLLHLRRERLTPAGPVDGDKLAQLVGALNHARQSLGHQAAMRGVARHLAHQQQRRVAQLHPLARLDGQRGNLLRRNLRNQFVDAAGDLHAVLVELALPQHAGENLRRSACSGVMTLGRRSLVGARARLVA
jgi:hypothetical protein